MHRNKLLALLDGFECSEALAAADGLPSTLARFRAFVRRQPDCFRRDCWDDGHVTASALVVNRDRSAMLLTLHAKLGKWLQLGGHADGETDPLAVALREVWEESGLAAKPLSTEAIDLDIHAIPARGREPAHFHYDVRFALAAESSLLVASHESLDLRWVPLDEVEAFTREKSILRLVAAARQWCR